MDSRQPSNTPIWKLWKNYFGDAGSNKLVLWYNIADCPLSADRKTCLYTQFAFILLIHLVLNDERCIVDTSGSQTRMPSTVK